MDRLYDFGVFYFLLQINIKIVAILQTLISLVCMIGYSIYYKDTEKSLRINSTFR